MKFEYRDVLTRRSPCIKCGVDYSTTDAWHARLCKFRKMRVAKRKKETSLSDK